VRDFPGPGGAVQVSLDGGTQPSWSDDGARLYYRNGNAVLEATFADGRSLAVQSRGVLVGADADVPDLVDVEAAAVGSRVVALRDAVAADGSGRTTGGRSCGSDCKYSARSEAQ
jgi:hypothetical protein